MEELTRFSDVILAAQNDGHLVWAAQGHGDGLGCAVRAWRHRSAVAVACPALSGRDRLAISGDPDDAAFLAANVLDEVGHSYCVCGERTLIDSLMERIPGMTRLHDFFWMDTTVRSCEDVTGVSWLDEKAENALPSFFDCFFADSFAQPGVTGVRRWAGVVGALTDAAEVVPLAVAAEAWSSARCGFMAGVLTRPASRGRGLGRAVSGFVVDALVHQYGRAALMVHADNLAAVAVYERLGMTKRLFTGAVRGPGHLT